MTCSNAATVIEALRGHARSMPERTAFRFLPAASSSTDLSFGALDTAALVPEAARELADLARFVVERDS